MEKIKSEQGKVLKEILGRKWKNVKKMKKSLEGNLYENY